MKVNIQKTIRTIIPMLTVCIKRVAPLITCFVLIVGIIVGSASPVRASNWDDAEPIYEYDTGSVYDWRDFIQKIDVSADNNIVTFTLSRNDSSIQYCTVYNFETGDYDVENLVDNATSITGLVGETALLTSVFGLQKYKKTSSNYSYRPARYFTTAGLPSELEIRVTYDVYFLDVTDTYIEESLVFWWMDVSDQSVQSWTANGLSFDYGEDEYGTYLLIDDWYTIDLEGIDAWSYMADIYCEGSISTFSVTEVQFSVCLTDYWLEYNGLAGDSSDSGSSGSDSSSGMTDTEIWDEINSQLAEQGTTMEEILVVQEETNQKLDGIQSSIDDTNEKLDGIQGGIDDTNEKLDDIITGSDDQQFAADELDGDMAEVTDKMDSAVGDLNSAGEVLGSVEQPEISFDSLVPGELLGASYVSFVNVLSCVWANSTLSQMMSVMTGMVIISLLLFGKKG